MSVTVVPTIRADYPRPGSLSFAYGGVLLFFLVYYLRPNEWLPDTGTFPFAKVAASIAILGWLAALPLMGSRLIRSVTSSPELKGLILLFAYMWLTIPSASWPGGSFRLLSTEYWKIIVVTIILGASVNSLPRLNKLLYVSTLSMAVLSLLAVRSYLMEVVLEGRVYGPFKGLFGNPNELALNLTLVLPFCFAFVVSARTWLVRFFWAICAVSMALGVLVTFSRGGFLALLVVGAMLIWEFGFKGHRPSLVFGSGLLALVVAVWLLPTGYDSRLKTIVDPELDQTGSAQARLELLQRSVSIIVERPLFGVGPGNFPVVFGVWKGTHNTFAQFGAEAGIPALLLFLWILRRAFLSIQRAIRGPGCHPNVQVLAQALRAALVALIVGALFYDAAYHFFAYFLIGYAVVISRISQPSSVAAGTCPREQKGLWQGALDGPGRTRAAGILSEENHHARGN